MLSLSLSAKLSHTHHDPAILSRNLPRRSKNRCPHKDLSTHTHLKYTSNHHKTETTQLFIHIPLGRGVCGTAAQRDATELVPDVHTFPGHIACDSASNSEIVIPIHSGGRVAAVLDIDSPILNRFSEADRTGLEGVVRVLEERIAF